MTRYGPFAETTPSGQTGWIDGRRRPVPEHLGLMLGKLDGTTRCTYSIWRGTNPESIIVTRRDVGETFIQAAGSAESLTVEVRLVGEDGDGRLYTVGRREPADGAEAVLSISSKRAVRVLSNEVFTADQAAEIFADYYLTDAVAETYTLREVDLSASSTD